MGKYDPDALKKINWLMRDWRQNKAIEMDPKTIDLLWEMHTELGSKEPIHIICGYRSEATNEHAAQDASAARPRRAST